MENIAEAFVTWQVSFDEFEPFRAYHNEYNTIHETIDVGNYTCGGSQKALIVRPEGTDSGTKYPLISFAHGVTVGGSKIRYYNTYFDRLASAGFIVIANESAPNNWCLTEYEDQALSIEYM